MKHDGAHRLRRVLVTTAVLLVGGCTLLPPPRAREVFVRPGSAEALATRNVELEEVSVDVGVGTPGVRGDTVYIYAVLLGRLNADRTASSTLGPLRLVVSVSETRFVSGFETKNAVSVETQVFEEPPAAGRRAIAIALYTEETQSTTSSYRYLYGIIERSLSEVFE